MDVDNKKNRKNNLPKDYVVNLNNPIIKKNLNSSDIIEDEFGNCSVLGQKIEANACSMLKDNYKDRDGYREYEEE